MDNYIQNSCKIIINNYSTSICNNVKLSDKDTCTGCGACVEVCIQAAISFKKMDDGFYYPFINNNLCVKCKKCEKVCPLRNDSFSYDIVNTFVFQNSNDLDLMNSSSGGAFTALAKNILQSGGIVYGCSFSPDFKTVEHVRVSNIDELIKIQKSKYVQSRTNQHFYRIKEELINNQVVLFSGTPCQVNALKRYLGNNYENLLTCAIVCHGVSSDVVWQSYIKEIETRYKATLVSYDFRDKSYGWYDYSVRAIFSNGKVYSTNHLNDPYMKCYLNNYSLRKSCYNCQLSGIRCGADILLGDAWEIEIKNKIPNINKGISKICVFSNKGIFYVDKLRNTNSTLLKIETEFFENRNVIRIPQNRDLFFSDIEHGFIFSNISKKYVKESIVTSMKRRIKFWMKMIFRVLTAR